MSHRNPWNFKWFVWENMTEMRGLTCWHIRSVSRFIRNPGNLSEIHEILNPGNSSNNRSVFLKIDKVWNYWMLAKWFCLIKGATPSIYIKIKPVASLMKTKTNYSAQTHTRLGSRTPSGKTKNAAAENSAPKTSYKWNL